MILIGKTLLLLVFELIIEYLFGTMLTKLVLKKSSNPGMNLLVGFMAYQALFQVLSLAVTLTTSVLHHLTFIWGVCLFIVVLLSIWIGKDVVKQQLLEYIQIAKQQKAVVLFAMCIIVAFCYYVSINGESNDDAQYYIALMTTSIDTDSLFQYNVYTGVEMESLYLRRALATFEIHSAVLSQMFGIHPLLVARIFRACQDVILTSVAVLLCSKTIFWRKEKDGVEKALLTVSVFWMIQIPFANTIYTPATFLLYRAYEAKAFTANFVVLFGLYLCIKLLRERSIRALLIVGIFLWGCMALSTSALVVASIECGFLLVPVWFVQWIERRKQEKLHAS